MSTRTPPPLDCGLCPRLAAFRAANRKALPSYYNAPVPSFGPRDAAVLIVGLAPGLHGANRTARPFTGDFAGDLLYATLLKFGFATGRYGAQPDDGLKLVGTRITNAVRCVPPANKPLSAEVKTCQTFLAREVLNPPRPRLAVALGRVAHESVLRVMGVKPSRFPFAHGAVHELDRLVLFDSYHCSRYNTNTGRLTEAMFHQVFKEVAARVPTA